MYTKIKVLGLLVVFILQAFFCAAQCNLAYFSLSEEVYCGDTVDLYAYVIDTTSQYQVDFNDSTLGGWTAAVGVDYTNPCGEGLDNTSHFWMGDSASQPRYLQSGLYDFSAGALICFELRYAAQSDPPPCEGPDEPDEGVYLQYSLDTGNTWLNIHYFDPFGGSDTNLTVWKNYCFNLPNEAQVDGLMIRWYQDAISGEEYDHWGLDNIKILTDNGQGYDFIWQPLGLTGYAATVPISNPMPPITVTAYDETDTCGLEVTLDVLPVQLDLFAGVDTVLCIEDCIELNGRAKVVLEENPEATFNGDAIFLLSISTMVSDSLMVDGLLMESIGQESIREVCINQFSGSLNFIGGSIICPDGNELVLFSPGSISSQSSILSICFSDAASTTIGNASPPYQGSYLPEGGLLNSLAGCSASGSWKLKIISSNNQAIFSSTGWNITFIDSSLTREVDYIWYPTEGLDNPFVLNPTICPDSTITYQLSVNDPTGCVSGSEEVTITVDQNCVVSVLELDEGMKVFVPNAFTPNGDGLNDIFLPVGDSLEGFLFFVYDRQGRLVFEAGKRGIGWNGTDLKGKALPQGVYIWELKNENTNGQVQEHSGKVTLIR